MKAHTKAAAATAAQLAAGLSAGYIFFKPFFLWIYGANVDFGHEIAMRLMVGIMWFPILFFGIWAWSALSKKSQGTGAVVNTENAQADLPLTTNKLGSVDESMSPKPDSDANRAGGAAHVSQIIILIRYVIIAFVLSCINPYWKLGFNEGLLQSVIILGGAVLVSGVIAGLTYIFFTTTTGKDWGGNFRRCLWVFLGLLLIGYWQPFIGNSPSVESRQSQGVTPPVVEKQKTQSASQGKVEIDKQSKFIRECVDKNNEDACYRACWSGDSLNENACLIACESGDSMSCMMLGNSYRDKDLNKAITFAEKACELKSAECSLLGIMYENGEGVIKDIPKAISLYKKSCDFKNPTACFSLGVMFFYGENVRQDKQLGLEYYGKACDLGDKLSCRLYNEERAAR